jgi:hypothetical protein
MLIPRSYEASEGIFLLSEYLRLTVNSFLMEFFMKTAGTGMSVSIRYEHFAGSCHTGTCFAQASPGHIHKTD